MFDVGGGELILILLVVLLLFGPKKLPELARSVGKGLRHVRKAQEDLTQQIRDISAEVAEPVQSISKDLKKDLNITLDPEATPRSAMKPAEEKTGKTENPRSRNEDPENPQKPKNPEEEV